MDEQDSRSDRSLTETTAHLHKGLKACSKVVASYRAMLKGEVVASDSEAESLPPEAG